MPQAAMPQAALLLLEPPQALLPASKRQVRQAQAPMR